MLGPFGAGRRRVLLRYTFLTVQFEGPAVFLIWLVVTGSVSGLAPWREEGRVAGGGGGRCA